MADEVGAVRTAWIRPGTGLGSALFAKQRLVALHTDGRPAALGVGLGHEIDICTGPRADIPVKSSGFAQKQVRFGSHGLSKSQAGVCCEQISACLKRIASPIRSGCFSLSINMAGAFCSHSHPDVFCHTGRGSQPIACLQTGSSNQFSNGGRRLQPALRPELAHPRQSRCGRVLQQVTRAVAEIDRPTAPAAGSGSTVTIDNKTDKVYTLVSVETARQPGLLPALSSMFQDFGVDVVKTSLDGDDSRSQGQFFVQSQSGSKLADGMEVERLQRAIESLLDTRFGLKIPRRPQVGGTRDADQRTALLYGLMGEVTCPPFSSMNRHCRCRHTILAAKTPLRS